MSLKPLSPLAMFGAVAVALSGSSFAQQTSPKLTITNTSTPIEIPLATASTVDFDANGDLRVQCRLDANNACPNAGSTGGGANAPTNVTLSPSTTELTAGASFTLTWGSSSNTEVCYGAGPTGITSWTGASLTPTGSRSLTLAEGSYVFSVRCYNADGSATAQTGTVTVNPSIVVQPSAYCEEFYTSGGRTMPTSPNFTAFGFTRDDATMQTVWGINPGETSTTRAGVPGNYMDTTIGRYLAIPFTMTDDTGSSLSQFTLDWIESNNTVSPPMPAGAISITISPCPGDFRPPTGFTNSTDPYLTFQCRISEPLISGNLTVASVSSLSGCPAPKDKIMYINVATYNMFGTSAPTTSTCGTNTACGVSMIVQ